MKQHKWVSTKYKLPPHNVQVINEYGCVVTYNHYTKKWKKANGRTTEVKVWRPKENDRETKTPCNVDN